MTQATSPLGQRGNGGGVSSRAERGEVTFKSFEETRHFWQRDPKLHLHFCRLLTCFLYPCRLSLELLKGGKSAHSLSVWKESQGREDRGEKEALQEPGPCDSNPSCGAFSPNLIISIPVIPPLSNHSSQELNTLCSKCFTHTRSHFILEITSEEVRMVFILQKKSKL